MNNNNNNNFNKLFFFIGIVFCYCSLVSSHSYLTAPISRGNQKQSNAGCRGPECRGPCDKPLSQSGRVSVVNVQRGQSITLEWPRNNHAGGFIRVAWSPTSLSDSHTSFDSNVQVISCHERGGCGPDDRTNLNGPDSGPADGSSRACKLTISVPPHLTDGDWTLQWSWFGGAFLLGDYYSCVDYRVNGGQLGVSPSPYFLGGDITYPNQQKCKFFNTDRLHQCTSEPCNAPLFNGEQSGIPFGFNGNSLPPVNNVPAIPSTTGSKPKPIPTPTPTPTPTPIPNPPSQNPTPNPTPNPPSQSNTPFTDSICATGYNYLSQSNAQIITVDTWGNTFRMQIQLTVKESLLSNWALEIIWPSNAVNTRVDAVFNAGVLVCESFNPNRHAIIKPANWAKNLYAGSEVSIEVIASNTNMNRDFIMANTQFKVIRI